MLRPIVSFGVVALAACRPAAPDPQLAAEWLRTSLTLARAERHSPPVSARISAYASIAMYEAYAADPRSQLRSMAGQLNGLWSVPSTPAGYALDGATAAAEAERVVLDSLYSDGMSDTRRIIDSLAGAQIEMRRRAGVNTDLRERSLRLGRAVGSAILAWAASDGFFATRGRAWRAPRSQDKWGITASTRGDSANVTKDMNRGTTLPRFNFFTPTEPYWGTLRTFALRNGHECAPPPPPDYSQRPGSPFWKIGKEFFDSALVLSDSQRAVARFWSGSPALVGMPGLQWLAIVNETMGARRLTADRAAEAYMLTSVAMADAYIGTWKEKYRSMVVRPLTYVRRVFDSGWEPVAVPPPFPEYPSDQATVSGAAAEVLVQLLGDSTPFTVTAQMESGALGRSFLRFTQARDEAAASVGHAGVQFFPAIVSGLAQGRCIGSRVIGRLRTRSGPAH